MPHTPQIVELDAALQLAAAIAERFACGWKPDSDKHGHAVWVPPKLCGATTASGEPEPMRRDEAEWLVARGWSFAISRPANQVKAGLVVRGWRPARAGRGRTWKWLDHDGKVVPYAKVTPAHIELLAAGQNLTDDELEARIEAHRRDDGDAYDRSGVPWLRDLLGGEDLDPRVAPIPWPPAETAGHPAPI
jgi:hypothetical protein